MINRIKTYYRVWYLMAANALQETFVNRWANMLFFIGKAVRLTMTLLVLFLIKSNISSFAGYTPDEMVMFFLTYQFIDVFAQIFYRGVYIFNNKVRTGEFDFLLAKPINPLFQSLTGKPDFNDALFFIPSTLISLYIASQLEITISLTSVVWFLVLLANSFLLATALHILILAVAIFTTEIDGAVWLYRDMMQLGRFPVNIYFAPIRIALFFLIPVGMMVTIPTEFLLQTSPTYSAAIVSLFSIGFFVASLKIWQFSLKHYSSASS